MDWSGRRDSNPRPSPWQGDALPAEPRPRWVAHNSNAAYAAAMRIGIFDSESLQSGIDGVLKAATTAAEEGFDSFWLPQIFGFDSLSIIGIVGREVSALPELGTAVIPTWLRHPMALATQALTAASATDNRFTLGIGLSHQIVIEGMLQIPWERPASHMEEYLNILMPLLRKHRVSYKGERLSALMRLDIPRAQPLNVPVMVAALGPRMLRLAGAHADGTATWMTGAHTIATHVTPTITAAAAEAGRPAPRIGVGLPFCVTTDIATARATAAKRYAMYGALPSYRAMLDREGVEGPEDVAVIGDISTVRAEIERLHAAGATDLIADTFGTEQERAVTRELLLSMKAEFRS